MNKVECLRRARCVCVCVCVLSTSLYASFVLSSMNSAIVRRRTRTLLHRWQGSTDRRRTSYYSVEPSCRWESWPTQVCGTSKPLAMLPCRYPAICGGARISTAYYTKLTRGHLEPWVSCRLQYIGNLCMRQLADRLSICRILANLKTC